VKRFVYHNQLLMTERIINNFLNIVTISLVTMFFSCTNSAKEVRDILADKNKPIGIAKNVKGNVVVLNHTDKVKLETNQLFWDQREKYFFTEDGFRLTTLTDTINGFGFEAKQNLTKWIAKDITGDVLAKQNEL